MTSHSLWTAEMESELVTAITKAVQSANDPAHYIAHDGKIWLDDVLRAMQKIERREFAMNCSGTFLEKHFDPRMPYPAWEYLSKRWQLGKPLSDQPEETKRFLHSLLCQ